MPKTFTHIPLDKIATTCAQLIRSAGKLSEAAGEARNAGLESIKLDWTTETEKAISRVAKLGAHAKEEVEEQIAEHERGVPLSRDRQTEKSRKDVAARKAKDEAAGVTPKKRGRPAKGA